MAHLYKKRVKGRTYWYLRETCREGRRVRVKWQKYLGTPESIMKRLTQAESAGEPLRLRCREFGGVFVVGELEREIDTIGIVDSIVPRSPREKGPSVGEYFFYAWANRLLEPKSKNALGEWFGKTAIDEIRAVKTKDLTSARYWEKWDRVSRSQVEAIADAFFRKVWSIQSSTPECVLFDTTNYFSYMSTPTESELFERGYNKAGKHHLRQVGLALVVDRCINLPIYYREYRGSEHDSKVFHRIIDEMFGVLCGFNRTKQRLTVVFDKGMNSEDNIAFIDDHQRVHFITTYSVYFAEDMAGVDTRHFVPLALDRNKVLDSGDRILAYRTRAELWGNERTVVVTLNPKTRRKKLRTLEQKLEKVRQSLLEFRRNFREGRPHWRDFDVIYQRYLRVCEQLHLGSHYYRLELVDNGYEFSFQKDHYQVSKAELLAGRNVIVTDNHDWTTEEIVQASLDRSVIERQFRSSKSHRYAGVNPIFHWTDGKVRCHLLTCIIALTMKRLLEMKVEVAGARHSAEELIERMRDLHSVIMWHPERRSPARQIEEPDKLQSVVLKSFGYEYRDGWVLQPNTR